MKNQEEREKKQRGTNGRDFGIKKIRIFHEEAGIKPGISRRSSQGFPWGFLDDLCGINQCCEAVRGPYTLKDQKCSS